MYAIAQEFTSNLGTIIRLAKSKLIELTLSADHNPLKLYSSKLWRETIQFFCTNEVSLKEMNDLLDYIKHQGINQEYSLKGRTLHSLTRNMKDWHYELGRVKRLGNATWAGFPVEDSTFEIDQVKNTTWIVNQIKTSKDLAREGTAMHHCVYSYQPRCISGNLTIWSVKKQVNMKGHHSGIDRCLTIEMDDNGNLRQIRGIANRLATREEMLAVKHWASGNNFRITSNY